MRDHVQRDRRRADAGRTVGRNFFGPVQTERSSDGRRHLERVDRVFTVLDDHDAARFGRDADLHFGRAGVRVASEPAGVVVHRVEAGVRGDRSDTQLVVVHHVHADQVDRGPLRVERIDGDVQSRSIGLIGTVARDVLDLDGHRVIAVHQRFDRDFPQTQTVGRCRPGHRADVRRVATDHALTHQFAIGENADLRVGFGHSGEGRLVDLRDAVVVRMAAVAGVEHVDRDQRGVRRVGIEVDVQRLGQLRA